jgi:CDP-diacylglycerol--glycerol-3-phosphate 3-phosphatidyltransferase
LAKINLLKDLAASLDATPSDMVPHIMALTTILPDSRRSWTLPNILTLGRMLTVPFVVACLFWPETFFMRWLALGLFTFAAITDFLDGYLARAWSQQSALGRMLDPIADKLLVSAILFMLVANQTVVGPSICAAIVILCREILVSGLREFLAEVKVALPVSRISKWKTTLQLLALGFLIAGAAGDALFGGGVTTIGIVLLWLAALLTLYTGWDYLVAGLRHITE